MDEITKRLTERIERFCIGEWACYALTITKAEARMIVDALASSKKPT